VIVVLSASILGKLDVNKSPHKHMGHHIEFSENDPQLSVGHSHTSYLVGNASPLAHGQQSPADHRNLKGYI